MSEADMTAEAAPQWLHGALAAVKRECNARPVHPAAERHARLFLVALELGESFLEVPKIRALSAGGPQSNLALTFRTPWKRLDVQFFSGSWRSLRVREPGGRGEVVAAAPYGRALAEAARGEIRWLYPELYPPVNLVPLADTTAQPPARVPRTADTAGLSVGELFGRAHDPAAEPAERVEALDGLLRRRGEWLPAERARYDEAYDELKAEIARRCFGTGRAWVESRGIRFTVDRYGELIRVLPR